MPFQQPHVHGFFFWFFFLFAARFESGKVITLFQIAQCLMHRLVTWHATIYRYGQAASPPVNGEFKRGCNDTVGAPGWQRCQDLDSAGFAVKLAHHIWSELPTARKRPFYLRWTAALERAMNATAKDPEGTGLLWSNTSAPVGDARDIASFYGCSTVVLIGFTCPAMTVVTVILRALDRVRERALGCFARSPKSPPARPCFGTFGKAVPAVG